MKKIILLISLFFAVQFASFAQENCCPSVDVQAAVFGCNIRICFTPSDGSEFCEGEIEFLTLIRDESNQVVAAINANDCFIWEGPSRVSLTL